MKEIPAASAAAKPVTAKPFAAFPEVITEAAVDGLAEEEADFVIMVLAEADF